MALQCSVGEAAIATAIAHCCTPDMCCCRENVGAVVVVWGVRAHTLKCTRAVNANDTYGGSPSVKVGFVVLAALYCSSSSALFFFFVLVSDIECVALFVLLPYLGIRVPLHWCMLIAAPS